MAFLSKYGRSSIATLLVAAPCVGACSLVLDSESLKAERADVSTLVDTTGQDTDTSDIALPPDTADILPNDDVDVPLDVAETVDPPDDTSDTIDPPDTVVPDDTEDVVDPPEDVVDPPEDVVDPPEDVVDPPEDIVQEPVLVFDHTGASGCILEYYTQAVTGCPKTCAWTFAFDASESINVTSFAWRFSVTQGYNVSTTTGEGPTPSVTIGTPSCSLFGAGDVGPAKLIVETAINGGTFDALKSIDFAVRQVSSCPATPRLECLGP